MLLQAGQRHALPLEASVAKFQEIHANMASPSVAKAIASARRFGLRFVRAMMTVGIRMEAAIALRLIIMSHSGAEV